MNLDLKTKNRKEFHFFSSLPFQPSQGNGRPSIPSLSLLPACSARPAGGPAALLPHRPTAPRPSSSAPACYCTGPLLGVLACSARLRPPHAPSPLFLSLRYWPRSSARARTRFTLLPHRAAGPTRQPPPSPFLLPHAPSLLCPADGARPNGKLPPPLLLQGKPPAPVWQAANQPCSPSIHTAPPTYKAELNPLSFSPFPLLVSNIPLPPANSPLPSANAIADPSRSSATIRRTRRYPQFAFWPCFAWIHPHPCAFSLSSRGRRRRPALELFRTPRTPP